MALYEILFGAEANTSNQAQSWLSHAEGEAALIVARGPEAFTDGLAHSIFLNARYRPMIAAARLRKRCILNEDRWKTIPWRNRVKTPNDTLLDIMAGIPEVLEHVDRYGDLGLQTPQSALIELETRSKCWMLHIQLEYWLNANGHYIYTPDSMTPTPITFATFELACLTIRYWVLALLLYSTLDTASRIPATDPEVTHPDRPHPRHFARLIARSAPFFFQDKFGTLGPTTVSFPLGNAMLYMRRDPVLDSEYLVIIKDTWNNPALPSAIKAFLDSLRLSVTQKPK
jgi:hypothetical protein